MTSTLGTRDPGGLISWGSDEHGSEYYFLAVEPDFETAGTFCDFPVRCFDSVDRPRLFAASGQGISWAPAEVTHFAGRSGSKATASRSPDTSRIC